MTPRSVLALLLIPALPWQPVWAAPSPRLAFEKVSLADDAVTDGPRPATQTDGDEEAQPATALDRARDLGLSGDDNRPGRQRETTLLGNRLILGGEISTSLRGRRHYDLERGTDGDDLRIEPEIKLEAIWLPSGTSVVFTSVRAFSELDIAKEGGRASRKAGIALDNFWWLKTDLFDTPLAIQIGRQRLRERREFWWDGNIDGVRLHYFGKSVTAYAGIGTPIAHFSTLGRMEPEDKGLLRAFGNLDWKWNKRQHIELFGLHQDDRTRRYSVGELIDRDNVDKEDARLTWLGVRARGCIKPGLVRRLCYWGDVARVRGVETRYDLDGVNARQQVVDTIERRLVRGWAYDAGVNLELPLEFRPVLTVARARGSGDRPRTPGVSGAFRQTGLHANDSKYRGLARFRSYGEVLRPDLSNIRVSTIALGLPLGKSSWVETIWHRYRQPFADNRITASPIGADPSGTDPRLGQEFDVSISHRPPSGWEFELTAGAFRAGPAFGPEAGRWAQLIEVKVDFNF